MKYRKKPIIIEAFRFFDHSKIAAFPAWAKDAIGKGIIYTGSDGWMISTMEGQMMVSDGDYIIQGIQGELYPCKPNIFEATYEEVE